MCGARRLSRSREVLSSNLHVFKVVMMSDFDSKGSGKHLKEEGEMTILGHETHLPPPFFF